MTIFTSMLIGFVGITTTIHIATIGIVALRLGFDRSPVSFGREGISLVRTIRDAGPLECGTLRSSFGLTHPLHEVIFCAAAESDPAVPVVRHLMQAVDSETARLLVGEDSISSNPKLNNMTKGWFAAKYDWIVFSDSNVRLPPDYLEKIMAAWREDTGLVCAPPIGSEPDGLWAEIECAFLNTYQARWQYAADSIGLGFAQGKTMLFRREVLERVGGIASLASELAEDAAATKLVRSLGLRVRLASGPFEQPLGAKSAAQVLARQIRWAQLRRSSFCIFFALEILTGCTLPMLAAVGAANSVGHSPFEAAGGLLVIWLGAEAVLAWIAGWHLSWRSPIAWLVRDFLLPWIWLRAWTASSYKWGGTRVVRSRDSLLLAERGPVRS
jgi:ceramide glucosyltransferase